MHTIIIVKEKRKKERKKRDKDLFVLTYMWLHLSSKVT